MEELEIQNPENQNEQAQDSESEVLVDPAANKQTRASGYIGSTLHIFMLVFGIVFLCSTFIFQILLTPIKVVGLSMYPTINASAKSDADEIHVDIVYYNKDKAYQNDDIVIVSNLEQNYIKDKNNDVQYFIKRVIACPGQTVTFFLTDKKHEKLEYGLYADVYYYDIIVKDSNGKTINIDDSFLKTDMRFSRYDYEANKHRPEFEKIFKNIFDDTLPDNERKSTITVKENTYFVMGDNRNTSEDSRYFGAVSYEDISGEVKLHVPYGTNLWSAVFKKIFA